MHTVLLIVTLVLGAVTSRSSGLTPVSYSATLERAGTYAYFCDRHRFMKGTVIVSQ